MVVALGFEDFGFHGGVGNLDGGGVELVVVGMGANETDEDDTCIEMKANDEAVGVALNVKNDAIARQNIGGAVAGFDVGEGFPVGVLRFVKPGFERLLRVGVLLPEFPERFPGDDAHVGRYKVPKMGTTSSSAHAKPSGYAISRTRTAGA